MAVQSEFSKSYVPPMRRLSVKSFQKVVFSVSRLTMNLNTERWEGFVFSIEAVVMETGLQP